MTNENISKIVDDAFAAASDAALSHISKHPGVWYPCGFAWVTIKPARGKLVSYLKSINAGRVSSEGGFMVYNPSNNSTQWMDAKYEGAQAFAKVLKDAGFSSVSAHSRMD